MIKIHNGLDMDREYLNLFHVPIQISKLELDIDSLIEFCYEIKRKNEKGVEKTNVGGWQSDNAVDETHTEFVKLKTKIEDAAKEYHEEINFKKTFEQKIDNIWVNINQRGHSNEFHQHPHSIFSGAFDKILSELFSLLALSFLNGNFDELILFKGLILSVLTSFNFSTQSIIELN